MMDRESESRPLRAHDRQQGPAEGCGQRQNHQGVPRAAFGNIPLPFLQGATGVHGFRDGLGDAVRDGLTFSYDVTATKDEGIEIRAYPAEAIRALVS